MSQKQSILAALQAGDRLTGLIALQRFNCMTLAQRVSELKHDGHAINERLIPNKPGGRKRVSEYWMDQPTGEQHADQSVESGLRALDQGAIAAGARAGSPQANGEIG